MDATRFDAVAKLFASHRLSRRQALAKGGAGLAAGALATAGLAAPARAQDAGQKSAQDAAQPDTKRGPTMLFVQSFQSGGVAAKDGAAGRYALTLEQGLGETVYFSDRPDLVVGSTPTPRFLAGLGFPEDNPPNAALIAETAPGETGIAVLRLYRPSYDQPTHTATYEVAAVQTWTRSQEQAFTETKAALPELLPQFGAAHLFIDDCPQGPIPCFAGGNWVGSIENAEHGGYCYSGSEATCLPCDPWFESIGDAVPYWTDQCNARFADCNGQCKAFGVYGA
jgi:hypothetical protein